jgi:WD40 repeat protein
VYQTLRLSLSAESRYLLADSGDKTFCFNLPQRKELWSRPVQRGQDHSLSGCAISGDGTLIVIAWETVTAAKKQYGASLWRGKDWKESLEVKLPNQAADIVLDPSGKWFAVPLIDSSLVIFDASTGKRTQTLKDHKGWPRRLAVSPDGKWLASADEKAGVFLWNTANWSKAKRFAVPADHVSIDGRSQLVAATLCYADDDDHPAAQVATVWNIITGKVAREVRVPGWKIRRAVLSPDGEQIACALRHTTDRTRQKAALIDLSSGQSRCELAADFEDIYDFAFLPDHKTIAVAVHGMHYKPVILWKVSPSNA